MNNKLINIDLLDCKIISELDLDARQPLSKLSKKLRKSRAVIDYRIKQLKKAGLIRNFVTLLDAGKLGLMIWNVYLEFQNLNEQTKAEIVKYLVDHKKVWWVGETTGNWNLIYSIFVKDVKEFYDTVIEFNTKFGSFILRQSLASHVEVEILSRGYLLNKPSVGVTWYKQFAPTKIDSCDKQILKELATDARISSVNIAKKIGSTARTVSYRIKNLQKEGIITRFRLQLDVNKIGYGFYKVIVHLKDYSKASDNQLKEYCRQLGNVFHYEKKIGPWMLELEIDGQNYESVNTLMETMKKTFPMTIKSYEILWVYNEPKGELDLTPYL